MSAMFPNKNDLKKGDFLIPIAFQLCCRICKQEGSGKSGGLEVKWYTLAAMSNI